jgi:nucleotide-binding universal stress UspA family protein
MSRVPRLLAATDLSAPARHAAERAALIAAETGAGLDLLHVASLAPLEKLRQLVGEVPADLEQQLLDASRHELRDIAANLHYRHGVTAGVQVLAGNLLQELAERRDALAADLVVLGAHGGGFMRHLLLGSTAEKIVCRTATPALVVKQAAHAPYRSVLVAVDFSPTSPAALRLARTIAPQAEIILLHALELPLEGKLRFANVDDATLARYQIAARAEAQQNLQALANAAGLADGSRQLLVQGNPATAIVEQEQEQDCDLIVVGKHGDTPLEELLLGSVTRHVLGESQSDVLIAV